MTLKQTTTITTIEGNEYIFNYNLNAALAPTSAEKKRWKEEGIKSNLVKLDISARHVAPNGYGKYATPVNISVYSDNEELADAIENQHKELAEEPKSKIEEFFIYHIREIVEDIIEDLRQS